MILTDIEIRDRILNYQKHNLARPLIESFEEKKLQAASYDVSITNEIYVIEDSDEIIDIRVKNNIDNMYKKVLIDDEGYILAPNQYILVTLRESITMPNDLVAHFRPRTSFTRLGLVLMSQHCNPNYSGVLKLGLFNATQKYVKIYSNIRIGQIIFEKLSNIPSIEKWYDNKADSKYNNETDFIGSKIYSELPEEGKKQVDSVVNSILDDVVRE